MSNVVSIAPAKAKRLIIERLKNFRPFANIIAIVAPNAAPEDTPIIYGSAIGFLNMPWNITPEPDNAIPTMTAINILGNLISKIIFTSWTFIDEISIKLRIPHTLLKIIFIVDSKERFAAPIEAAIIMRIIIITTRIIIILNAFLFILK
jgi:hypothetical protein